jgi:cytochrome c-type biogenesis protein CcmF
MDIADVTVFHKGDEIAHLRPRIDQFSQMPMSIAGAHSTIQNDFYVLLVGWEEIGYSSATFKVFINPLINLVWLGGLVLIIGTFISAYPHEAIYASVKEKFSSPASGEIAGARA